ncbi:hypothetical protein [Sinomonas humi]|uniref:Uncharacterized protein n=1 Tax=Sinomonas humi TaxID=1338436 RepID=A0A0B2AJN2_9MICC|nr:hypothetical protein [Sinomonas humi]KHL03546.1 hypothetical protein LK10_09055 [Sinomonas humi]
MSSDSMREMVAEILSDAGLADDGALTRTLESLQTMCPAEAPAPTGALAELLAQGTAASGGVAPSRAATRAAEAAIGKLSPQVAPVVPFTLRKRHRGAAISAAVIAGVGLSATGVAALGGVDYSANPPQAGARSAIVAPQAGADAAAQGETSEAPDPVVREAQAFAAAAGGSPVAHADRSPAPTSGGKDAPASSGVVFPSAPPAHEAPAEAAIAPAAARVEDPSAVAQDAGAALSQRPAPRHRAEPVVNRGRHIAQEAAATAQAIAATFAPAPESTAVASPPVKEAVAVASGAGQHAASAAAGALGQQHGNSSGRALAALGTRH